MKIEHRIIGFSFLFGIIIWVIDSLLDSLLFHKESSGGVLIFDMPALIWIIGFILFGIILARVVAGQKRAEESLKESEKTLRTITDTAKDAIVMMDDDGAISFWNPAAEKIFKYTSQEALGKELHAFLGSPRHYEAYREGFKRFKDTGEGFAIGKTLELQALRRDGVEIPIELSLSAIQVKGRWYSTGIIRDISERKKSEEELKKHRGQLEERVKERTAELITVNEHLHRENIERRKAEEELYKSEKFFSTVFDSIRDPFGIIDRDYRIIKANEAYAQMRNKSVKDLIGRRCYEVLQNRETICKECIVEKTFKSADPCAKNKFLTFPDGAGIGVEIYTYPIFDEHGAVSQVIEYTRDITDRKKAEEENKRLIEKLEYLSNTDSLTGVLNRRALIERLEYEVDRAKRYGAEFSLVLCDMDKFKEINDTHGHVAGDMVLQILAEVIGGVLRTTDVLGRYGGDEFMVILPETALQGAENLAERICLSMANQELTLTEKQTVKMSLSLGVTCFNAFTENIDDLIKRADIALYESKRKGGNKVTVIDPDKI